MSNVVEACRMRLACCFFRLSAAVRAACGRQALYRYPDGRQGCAEDDDKKGDAEEVVDRLSSGLIDLETLGMALETDIADLAPGCRIDDRKRTAAVADKNAMTLIVDPHIVGVVAEFDAPDRRQVIAAQRPYRTAPTFAT